MTAVPFRRIEDLGVRLDNEAVAAWITATTSDADTLRIELTVRGEGDERSDTRAVIDCGGVLRWALTKQLDDLRLYDEHPALLPLVGERAALSFRGAPRDPELAALEILAAHEKVIGGYLAFEDCANVSELRSLAVVLGGGHGIVGEGPSVVLDAYAAVLERHGVRPWIIDRRPARTWDPELREHVEMPPGVRVLDFGDGFVAARTIAVSGELPPLNSWDGDD